MYTGELKWIEVITTNSDETTRQSSLLINRSDNGTFRVVGNLPHGSEISFTKDQAQKLIKELKKIK